MQSDCNQCQDLLWSYLAHELSDSEAKKLETHLQGCPSCQAEAEMLTQVVSSLREEIPLPATFSAELHQKLSLASQEMTTGKPNLRKRFLEGFKGLPKYPVFRTLAPALVCLVLVVGVFSSGLFDQWNTADQILNEPTGNTPVSTSNPVETASPSHPANTDAPSPSGESSTPTTTPQTKSPITPTGKPSQAIASTNPASAEPEPTPDTETPATETPVTPAIESAPASAEDIPSPASIEDEDTPVIFAIPRHRPKVVCLTVEDAEVFLNNWQDATGYDWEPYIQDVSANELVLDADPTSPVLELSSDAFNSLMDYAAETEPLQENQGETLVVIAGNEG